MLVNITMPLKLFLCITECQFFILKLYGHILVVRCQPVKEWFMSIPLTARNLALLTTGMEYKE